jgi:hypothetical protein
LSNSSVPPHELDRPGRAAISRRAFLQCGLLGFGAVFLGLLVKIQPVCSSAICFTAWGQTDIALLQLDSPFTGYPESTAGQEGAYAN